jgi:hypothetical protein
MNKVLKRATALGEMNDWCRESEKVCKKWRQTGLGRVFDDGQLA